MCVMRACVVCCVRSCCALCVFVCCVLCASCPVRWVCELYVLRVVRVVSCVSNVVCRVYWVMCASSVLSVV